MNFLLLSALFTIIVIKSTSNSSRKKAVIIGTGHYLNYAVRLHIMTKTVNSSGTVNSDSYRAITVRIILK